MHLQGLISECYKFYKSRHAQSPFFQFYYHLWFHESVI